MRTVAHVVRQLRAYGSCVQIRLCGLFDVCRRSLDSAARALQRLSWRTPLAAQLLLVITYLAVQTSDPIEAAGQPVIRVGPQHAVTRIAAAALIAKDGDTIEIDAADYVDDVASWPQSDLTIRAVGGRARLRSQTTNAEGKAIWVIKGNNVVVENIEFSGSHVPSRNGAGIRHEGGKLTIRNCLFQHNEMGILTWNDESAALVIEASEFRSNGGAEQYKQTDPGHQIYVGTIARFELRYSYIHDGVFGHLVKSRARENHVFYNRITDERGRASYEVEFPNGGIAYLIGNIVQQSSATDNPIMISYGAEGYKWPRNELYLVNNTLVDERAGDGTFLRVRPGAINLLAMNNLLVGSGVLESAGAGRYISNYTAGSADLVTEGREYRLRAGSALVGQAAGAGEANGVSLRPQREYAHPLRGMSIENLPLVPGALQQLAP